MLLNYQVRQILKHTRIDNMHRVVVIVWWLDLQLPVQSVPVTTNVERSTPHMIQHYGIKFVSDLRQVGKFLRILSSTNKTDPMI
jgi:hypothetical protein